MGIWFIPAEGRGLCRDGLGGWGGRNLTARIRRARGIRNGRGIVSAVNERCSSSSPFTLEATSDGFLRHAFALCGGRRQLVPMILLPLALLELGAMPLFFLRLCWSTVCIFIVYENCKL